MSFKPGKPAAWITALLLACYTLPAAADVTAGVAAYQRRDFAGALREFQQAAQRDDVRALIYLGIMHADGVGTPRDYRQAAMLFSKAAMLGSPEAMANLGRMHAEGRGVPQDNKAAVAAYSAAARSGFQPAMTRMAEIYEKGELGVAPDPALAREWRAQASGRPPQIAPAAATQPSEPAETPDMVALARAARNQLQEPQTPTAAAAPPRVASPEPAAIAPAVATPQAVPAQERQPPSLPATPPPVAVPAPEPAPIAAVTAQPDPIQAQPSPAPDTAPRQTAPANNVIESIAVTLQSGEILIRVRTSFPLAAPPADFVVAAPPRIVFDFMQTSTGLGRYHEVGEGDLQSVDVIAGDTRTRMVLILRNSMQHDVRMDGGDLLIRLKSIPATSGSVGNQPRRSGR